jgi:hypothetical protein
LELAMPLTARLQRSPSTDQGTFGVLTFGTQAVRTLELPWRENRRQVSCIPPGTYRCSMVRSPKFGRVYHVASVPGRSAVLIHSANLAGDADKGYTTQLQGCIAPCLRTGLMRNKTGVMQMAGLLSRPALNQLTAWAAGAPFDLEIT